jgi:hypothetical protein
MRSLLGQRRAFSGWTAAAALEDYLNLLGVVTFCDEREFLYRTRQRREMPAADNAALHCNPAKRRLPFRR